MLTDMEREEGVRDKSWSWRILPNAYLKVLVGNRGTGPLRLLQDKSLESSEALVSSQLRDSIEQTAQSILLRESRVTDKKESCGILDSDSGKDPDKLLLLSLLWRRSRRKD